MNCKNLFVLRTLAAFFCCYYFNIFSTKFKGDIERNFFFFVKCLQQIKAFTEINFQKKIFACIYFRSCLKFNNCVYYFYRWESTNFLKVSVYRFPMGYFSIPKFTCFFLQCKLNKRNFLLRNFANRRTKNSQTLIFAKNNTNCNLRKESLNKKTKIYWKQKSALQKLYNKDNNKNLKVH